MTAKEYLSQAYRLNHIIDSNLRELKRLHDVATEISSPVFTERVQTERNTEAPFVKSVEKIVELEHMIDSEVDRLVDLRVEIHKVIEDVEDPSEQLVLRYRYIMGYTWEKIGEALGVDSRTVRRWHSKALQHVKVPKK